MEIITEPSCTWETRKRSWLIKCLMKDAGLSVDDLAQYFGISKAYLNTKLARDSFSINDVMLALCLTGRNIAILDENNEIAQVINPRTWLKGYDDESLLRLRAVESAKKEAVRAKYRSEIAKLESRLETLKREYDLEE